MSKRDFKYMVRTATMKYAFSELQKRQQIHSKMNNINYNELSIQMYLTSQGHFIHFKEAQNIFKGRIRMHDVKCNFKNVYEDVDCLGCKTSEDSQRHILTCSIINPNHTEDYDDLFSNDVIKQHNVSQALVRCLKERKKYEK